MPRRPRRTTIDPLWLQHGAVGQATAHEDVYFEDDDDGSDLDVLMDGLLSLLPDNERAAIEVVVIAGHPYSEAGRLADVDRKTAWGWVQRGLGRLAGWLASPWAAPDIAERLGIDEAEAALLAIHAAEHLNERARY